MDFFATQELARKRTKWMVVLFGLAVLCITLAIYLLVVYLTGPGMLGSSDAPSFRERIVDPMLFLGTLGGVVLLVGGSALFKINQLRAGGGYVAQSVGGRHVPHSTTNADERQLLNIVEEMSIASGVPAPDVYILEEPGINAFAAGFNPGDAVVAVTRGCIETLTRDELQGVVAHEFSHILNGDMRMNIRLMGVLFGILAIAVVGQTVMRGAMHASFYGGGRRRSKEGGGGAIALILIGLAVMAIGYIGVLFGRLIQSAISRQREYLADAAAVQFTRNPEGISGALKKIGGSGIGGRVKNAHTQETAHFFFANALTPGVFNSFATHPPLPKRIRAIEPSWDGSFVQPKVKARSRKEPPPLDRRGGGAGNRPNDFIQNIGILTAATIGQAQAIRKSVESELSTLHAHADNAKAVLIALVIAATSEKDDDAQLAILKKRIDGAVYREVGGWIEKLRNMNLNQRFALLDAALPMSAESGVEAIGDYPGLLTELAHSTGEVNLEELAVMKTTTGFIEQRRNPTKRLAPLAPAEVEMPICVLLSAIVYATGATGDAAQAAFMAGARKCNRYLLRKPILLPEDTVCYESLETALELMANLPNPQKKIIFEGALAVVLADGKVEQEELSLIRVIAASIGLPMPPLQV